LKDRIYDEKFGILNAPQLFFPDLYYFRETCGIRSIPLCVAYVDIDDFKSFNEKYTETKVDINLLPKFMTALEVQIYHHGYAYRYGGDEYVILLPNMSKDLAVTLLKKLQGILQELNYPEIDGFVQVSIGLFEISANCLLTDREIEQKASKAKKYAKIDCL